MRWVLLAAVLTGCRAVVPVPQPDAVDPPGPIDPAPEPEAAPEPTSDEPVRVHIGGTIVVLEEGETRDPEAIPASRDFWEDLGAAVAATTSRDVLVTISDRKDMGTVDQIVNWIAQRGAQPIFRFEENGEARDLVLRERSRPITAPSGCTRMRLHPEGRGIRVDLEGEAGVVRLGRVMELPDLPQETATVEPGLCPEFVVEVYDANRWSEILELIPTLLGLGATELVLGSRSLYAVQSYEAYPWSKSLGRLRINHVMAGGDTGWEGHREFWSVGPARGAALFEGPLPPWQPDSFVLELPEGDYDLDVYGMINFGGTYHECGTTTRVRARRETVLHHNLLSSECTVAPKSAPVEQHSRYARARAKSSYRAVTIKRDAERGERKPWVVRATTADPKGSTFFDFLVPPTMLEATIPLPEGELDFSFREVSLTVDRPTEWCIGSFGGKECRALEAEVKNACDVRVTDPGPQVVTYRPGQGCDARPPAKRKKRRRRKR